MRKVFLSHSSADKNYVEIVAKKIGFDNCVYDKYTFEEGMDTLDEIYAGLEETDIFVFFISNTSLESEWVKKERKKAKTLLDEGSLTRFYPIIIDEKIQYDDDRIPDWIQKKYNIKLIKGPNIAANRIHSRMREVVWGVNHRLKQKNLFFIGRNDETAKFESRRADFDKEELKCINASSAFNGIGRKAYMAHVLKKGNMMGQSHDYNLISLEKHESIEDFILKTSDLCSGIAEPEKVVHMSMDEKIDFASQLVKYMQEHNEYIFINDEGVIVKPNSEMVDWFQRIIEKINPKLVLCIASIYNLHMRRTLGSVFTTQIQELSKEERSLMLKECCTIEGINITNDNLKIIASNLSGYPEQVFYVVQMIKDDGIHRTLEQLHEVKEYADARSKVVIERYANSEEQQDFLVFLASFDFVGYEILDKVFINHPEYKNMLDSFISVSICEFVGAEGEYIRVNDVLKDTIFRRRMSMGEELSTVFNELADCTVNDEFVHSTDLSQYYNVIRNKIDAGNYDEKYIIPSHYLKSIVKHYNSREYEKASLLCKKIIDGERISSFDKEIIYAIYYYYCQSLAREHKMRDFFSAIDYKEFKNEDRLFLQGFYHRINGEPEKAIENLSKALIKRPHFPKAKRELANAYLASEDFESAERLCIDNYHDDKNNPYYIQPYFESLIHKYISIVNSPEELSDMDKAVKFDKKEEISKTMEEMLDSMKKMDLPKAKQMYVSMLAEYYAIVKNDFKSAICELDKGIAQEKDALIYLYLTKFDIAYRFKELSLMRESLEKIESIVTNQKYFSNALNLRRARFFAVNKDKENAAATLDNVRNMPDHAMEKFKEEIEKMSS